LALIVLGSVVVDGFMLCFAAVAAQRVRQGIDDDEISLVARVLGAFKIAAGVVDLLGKEQVGIAGHGGERRVREPRIFTTWTRPLART
jgi:hypothetical protein